MSQDWLDSNGQVVHPGAPRGAGGAGGFRGPRQFGADGEVHGIPHPNSPVGRSDSLTRIQKAVVQAHDAQLKYNLVAQAAVDYVKAKMTLGALNKFSDVINSAGGSVICVMAQRPVIAEWKSLPTEQYMRRIAMTAAANGCGNCGEQSATAFIYLLDLNVRPLDWMALQPPGDHNYVVVGRVAGSDDSNPLTWGPAAVVCDPWKGEIYAPSMIFSLWHHYPVSAYRVD